MASTSTANALTQLSVANMSPNLTDALAYQGFDPVNIHVLLRQYNPNALQLNIDIEFLVTLVLSRGSNIFSKTSNLLPEVRERFNRLVIIYHIERKLTASSPRDTVTLSRILKCYPDYAFNILLKQPNIRRPVSTEVMSTQLGYKKFPSCLRGDFVFSLVPGKTPNGKNYMGIIKAVLHYQLQESKILSSRLYISAPPTDVERLENIIHYASVSWYKSFVQPDIKKSFMDKTQLSQKEMDAWAGNFNKHFPMFKDIGFKFGY